MTILLFVVLMLGVSYSMERPILADSNVTLSPGTQTEIPTVNFCDLVKNSEAYTGKFVRVRAQYFSTWEFNVLYDSKCNTVDQHVLPELSCQDDRSCESQINKLRRDLRGNRYTGLKVQLLMIGKLKRTPSGQPPRWPRLTFEIHEIEETKPPQPQYAKGKRRT